MRTQLLAIATGAAMLAGCGDTAPPAMDETMPEPPASAGDGSYDMSSEEATGSDGAMEPTQASPPDEPTSEYGGAAARK